MCSRILFVVLIFMCLSVNAAENVVLNSQFNSKSNSILIEKNLFLNIDKIDDADEVLDYMEYIVNSKQKEIFNVIIYMPEVVKRFPQNDRAYYILSCARYRNGFYHLGLEAFEKSVKLNRKNRVYRKGIVQNFSNLEFRIPFSYLNKGISEYLAGKDKEAIKTFNFILKKFPEFAYNDVVYYGLSLAKEKIGDKKGSQLAFEKACNINERIYFWKTRASDGFGKSWR